MTYEDALSAQIVPFSQKDTGSNTFYPRDWVQTEGMPTLDNFEIFAIEPIGRGIQAKVPFKRGETVAKFTGQLMNKILQHTLQVSATSHVHDPYFIGLLTHSCAPNCLLDMQQLEILALTDISAGAILSVDYALTEDVLYQQFPCTCGSAHCRRWVTGRREEVNAEGYAYLASEALRKC
jgi:hypothetical protein